MNPKNETRTTALFQELDEISKGQKSYTTFLNHQKNEQNYLSLKDYIDDYFFQHPDITPSVIIQDSNLSRNYVYPICNGTKHPTKYKLVAFCIGAHMTLKETQKALTLAGCSQLYPKIPVDSRIIICINRKCKSVTEVGLFLSENGLESPF